MKLWIALAILATELAIAGSVKNMAAELARIQSTLDTVGAQCAQTRCGTTVVAPGSPVPESAPEPSSGWGGRL